jgi:nucleotidyltransferase substrate binding protein (TIGR01987 family)
MRERTERNLKDFEKAFENLKNAVFIAKTELEIDGAIKRFELCYELVWKLIKNVLEDMGIICKSPRECFKQAVKTGLISDESIWMEMIEDRNFLVHTYSSEDSRYVFENVKKKYLKGFESLIKAIKEIKENE